MRAADYIQTGIFVVIAATCIFTGISVSDQTKFNKNALRPWVMLEPVDTFSIVNDTMIKWYISAKCYGRTPALNLKVASKLNLNENNPYQSGATESPGDVIAFLFPDHVGFSRGMRPLSDLGIDNIAATDSSCRLFLHIWVSYYDVNKKPKHETWATYECKKPFILRRENMYSYSVASINSGFK
jgi:hypothetical protein